MLIREFIKQMFQFLVEADLPIINSILRLGMTIQKKDMTPATS
jgi:hypothetical protein